MTTATLHEYVVPPEMRDSPTMSAAAMADAAKARGKKVEVVTVGDLFPKPAVDEVEGWVRQLVADAKADGAAQEKFKLPATGYAYSPTTGIPSLRAAAAECFTRDTGLAATTADVCIGTGGKGALNGALSFLKPGATVFVAAPGWPTNYDMFPMGVKIIEVATGDGILRAGALKLALDAYGEPAAILINAPCNPTGANYTAEEREAFFALVNAATKTTIVASDDPYGKLVFDRTPYNVATVINRGPQEKTLYDATRLLCFRTVSKEYGLAGLRVGFVVTKHKEALSSLKKWNESKGGGMGVEDQIKAQGALMYGDGFITRTVRELLEKRAMLMEGIGALSFATMNPPRGTIYGWVDFSGLNGKTVVETESETGAAYVIDSPVTMMRYLVNVAGVCGVSGTPFYAPATATQQASPAAARDWHVRISFCCEKDQLVQVIANLKAAESKLKTNGSAAA